MDCTKEGPARFAKSGLASKEGTPPQTLIELMKTCKEKFGDMPAMCVERGLGALSFDSKKKPVVPPDTDRKDWKTWSYTDYLDDTAKVAKAFMNLGMGLRDTVVVFGFNAPEWFLAETGAIYGGGKAAGIYPTDTVEQVTYKCQHSGAVIAVCENEKKLKTMIEVVKSGKCPKLKALIVWDVQNELPAAPNTECKVMTWEDLLAFGMDIKDKDLEARHEATSPYNVAALIYTSGTTGAPKAVMISHDNIIFEAMGVYKLVPSIGGTEGAQERVLSYLPLSHVAGMLVDIISPMILTATTKSYATVYFARPYDLKYGTIGNRLRCVRPTLFLGVPRVWEKIAEKMKAIGAQTTGLKKKIAGWAKGKGLAHAKNCQIGGTGEKPGGHGTAESIVLSKIKTALGLDECKFGFTGAAPIAAHTLEYFGSLGINVNEVYGMSECTGATTFSTDESHLWGSCGFAMPGHEVKILRKSEDGKEGKLQECPRAKDIFKPTEEEQGEICFRGRHIMMGYMANPDMGEEHMATIKKKNESAIDKDGWLHSGDKGCMSEEGMVKITGRYKELIIGAGGENIAPVPVETMWKKLCPALSNVMMFGDKRKFNVALVTLKTEGSNGENPGSDILTGDAAKIAEGLSSLKEAMGDDRVKEYLEKGRIATNQSEAVPMNAAKIQRFTILPTDFSVATGELTSTLKLKRSVAAKKYMAMIEKIYGASRDVGAYIKYSEE